MCSMCLLVPQFLLITPPISIYPIDKLNKFDSLIKPISKMSIYLLFKWMENN